MLALCVACVLSTSTDSCPSRAEQSWEPAQCVPWLYRFPLLLFQITSHLPKVPKQPLMLEAPQESSWKLCLDTKGAQPEKSKEGLHSLSLPDPLPPIEPSVEQNKMLPYGAKVEEPEGFPSLSLAEKDSVIRLSSAEENEASHSAETFGSNRETEDWDFEVGADGAEEDVESFFMTQVCEFGQPTPSAFEKP